MRLLALAGSKWLMKLKEAVNEDTRDVAVLALLQIRACLH